MKNLIIILPILVSLLFFQSCKNTNETDAQNCPPPAEVDQKKLISDQEARQYYDEYTSKNYQAISEYRNSINISQPDSRSYWYSIKELESYLYYLKNHPATQENYESLGIRFYIGTYPEETTINGANASGYQNIFLYPTLEGENPFANEEYGATQKKSAAIMQSGTSPLGYNKGKYSPPN